MKYLPNLLTLCNLICGCIAITFILGVHPHLITITGEDWYRVEGTEQLYLGSLFIFLAALFDVFDGLAARVLNVFSPIGKDLDSLADIVSFGVAPAMILYQLLWITYMSQPNALTVSPLAMLPAFALPCFAAIRLARFNQNNLEQAQYFKGMPSPAAGIFVALLPLVLQYDSVSIFEFLQQKWVIYGIIVLLCWLMVSEIKFLKWKAPVNGVGGWWAHILIILTALVGYPFIGYSALLLAFVVYTICSVVYPYPAQNAATKNR